MVRFRTLGAIDLRRSDGASVQDVLNQPKRIGLLTFLCLGNGSFQPRDRVLAMFWPEHPSESARNNLRQSLHFLKRHLPGAIAKRGRHEVGADPDGLQCDASRFDALAADGRNREALELYSGPLLDGFFLSDCRPFEQWLEGKRHELASRAVDAAFHLAEAHWDAGERGAASFYAARAATIGETSELTARRVMRFLRGIGDHAGALNVYYSLGKRLRALFGEEPTEATRQLAEELRSEGRAQTPTEVDFKLVNDLLDGWGSALMEGRLDDAMAMLTEDVVLVPPMEPMCRGRAEARAFFEARPPALDLGYELIDIRGSATELTYRTRMRVTVELPHGEQVTMYARAQSQVERQPDGRWLCSTIMWNLEEPGPVV